MHPDLLAGRYELTQRLAGGGMGQVWQAQDRTLERAVAIKTVDLSSPDATLSERFRREAVATAGLTHPNIVQVYDAGTDGTTAFLVMELLSGPSLHELVRDQGRLPIPDGLRVAREVARGLLAAHAIGVVHRDIKPGNVMYDADRIKLVDFGIAQLSERMGATLTAPATALGTAAYMSPEQATGVGATPASDWYALGCLLMTVFTGEPPFQGDAVHVATQQVDARPPRLSERRDGIPPALDDLVDRLLAKEPTQRPTGQQVIDQVRALEADPNAPTMLLAAAPPARTVAATAVLPVTPAEPPHPRQAQLAELEDEDRGARWPLVLLALVLVAALAAGAYWLVNRQQAPAPAAPSAVPSAPAKSSVAPPPPPPPPPTSARPTKPSATPTPVRPSATPTRTSASAAPTPSRRTPTATQSPSADALQQAIDQVGDEDAREQLEKAAEDDRKNQGDKFAQTVEKLARKGTLTSAEAELLRQAVTG